MRNSQQGFIGLAIAIIIGLALIGGGTYFYLNKVHERKGNDLSTTSNTSSITDLKDVKDFDTCMSYARNAQISFDIVFSHGSDFQQVQEFSDDFKNKYPRATLEKISSETDYLNNAVEMNKSKIYTESQMTDYKKMIAAQANSAISIKVPVIDLGTKESFDNFISITLRKYPSITFQQYAGSSPENSLDADVIKMSQQSAEKQCNYKYKQLNESDRSALQIKNDDSLIQTLISSTRVGATLYHDDHNSYGIGSLSLNNGLCADAGVNGIKKMLDSIKEKAGAVYCYASSDAYAVSAPLKSNPATGYCSDSTGFYGAVSSPTAASKGYCNLPPPEKKTDISSCQNGKTARERWICVGNIVDPQYNISDLVSPYAKPNADKINSCKALSGIEADYCFASIVKSGTAPGFTQKGASICAMVSNKNPWFKNDCTID
ncbi:MAG: hypothetical protein AAB899_02335 [Patescibacteria group bacterium]